MNIKTELGSYNPSKFAIIALFIAVMSGGCQTEVGSTAEIPKAIFIIVDGIPADVLENVDTPHFDSVSGAGGYARAYVGGEIGGESESPTVSAVGYNSLLTGTWANKHNVYDNAVNDPDYRYWDIFRIAKSHNPDLQTAVFSTWTDNRTKLVGDGLAEAGGKKLDYYFDGLELDTERFPHDIYGNYIREIDALVADDTARHIREAGPALSWVYLEHTDDIGHRYGDSPEMNDAVRIMDQRIGVIWSAVEVRQNETDEDWLVVITTDHGRDAATGMNHSEHSERERTTWIVTNSRRLNTHFSDLPGVVDILPSIVTHLGLQMPEEIRAQLDGRSFID